MSTKPITAIFAGYDRLFQEGMRLLLGERFEIVQYIASFEGALEAMRAGNLDVDLVIGDPGLNVAPELEAISAARREFPKTKVIVLAHQIDHSMLNTLLECGAGAVLSSDISVTAILCSIEIVMLGERIIPTVLSSEGRSSAVPPQPSELAVVDDTADVENSLSNRERQILHCLVDGQRNKSIARNLGMTESTVKVHLKMLLRKLRIQNRTQAAIWAYNHGFVSNEESQSPSVDTAPEPPTEIESRFANAIQTNGRDRAAANSPKAEYPYGF